MRENWSGAGTPFEYPLFDGYGRAPYASVVVGALAVLAGANGVAVGAFAWVDSESGLASNAVIDGAAMGLVLPVPRIWDWEVATTSYANGFPQRVLRPGMTCVVAANGDFRPVFPQGGVAGMQVYADPATGLPYAGQAQPNYVASGWTLMQNGGPRARLRMSSSVQPFN